MVFGGDIDKAALLESFSRIKEDIARTNQEILRLNTELFDLKLEHKRVLEENLVLKKQLSSSDPGPAKVLSHEELVTRIVKETLTNLNKSAKPASNDIFLKKISKKRRNITLNRIQILAAEKHMCLSDIKEIIVDDEGLCSKATFYRYIEGMKKKGQLDLLKIDDREVVIKL